MTRAEAALAAYLAKTYPDLSPRDIIKLIASGLPKEYAYENAEAYRQAHQGNAALKQREFARATQHYERALGIFHSVSNDMEEWQCRRDIASVDLERQIEEEHKGISPRQDVLI